MPKPSTPLTTEDRGMILEIYADHLSLKKQVVEIEQQMLALAEQAHALRKKADSISIGAIAEKYDTSYGRIYQVVLAARRRRDTRVRASSGG